MTDRLRALSAGDVVCEHYKDQDDPDFWEHIAPLDTAWAEVEALLPEGWTFHGVVHGSPTGEPGWMASAYRIHGYHDEERFAACERTPIEALRGLATQLKER